MQYMVLLLFLLLCLYSFVCVLWLCFYLSVCAPGLVFVLVLILVVFLLLCLCLCFTSRESDVGWLQWRTMVYLVLVLVLLCLLEPEDSLHWKLVGRRLCFCVWVCTPLIVLWTSAELVGFLLLNRAGLINLDSGLLGLWLRLCFCFFVRGNPNH